MHLSQLIATSAKRKCKIGRGGLTAADHSRTQEDSHFDSSIDDSMYSLLFPGGFLHVVCRWSRMVGMHTCFSTFPSGLLIHGGPHRPVGWYCTCRKVYLLGIFLHPTSVSDKVEYVKDNRSRSAYRLIIHTREEVRIKINDLKRLLAVVLIESLGQELLRISSVMAAAIVGFVPMPF